MPKPSSSRSSVESDLRKIAKPKKSSSSSSSAKTAKVIKAQPTSPKASLKSSTAAATAATAVLTVSTPKTFKKSSSTSKTKPATVAPVVVDNDYGYEDDFEDYEDDFEALDDEENDDDDDETQRRYGNNTFINDNDDDDDDDDDSVRVNHASSPKEQRQVPSNEVLGVIRAIDQENERVSCSADSRFRSQPQLQSPPTVRHQSSHTSLAPSSQPAQQQQAPQTARPSRFLDLGSAAQRETRAGNAVGRRTRAHELRRLIDLDVVAFTLLDMAPLTEYELYIRNCGSANSLQAASQTNEDATAVETQTEPIARTSRWSQHPPDTLIACAAAVDSHDNPDMSNHIDAHNSTAKSNKKKKSRESSTYSTSAATHEPRDKTTFDHDHESLTLAVDYDIVALSRFLARAGHVVESLLNERPSHESLDATLTQEQQSELKRHKSSNYCRPGAISPSSLQLPSLPFLVNRPLCALASSADTHYSSHALSALMSTRECSLMATAYGLHSAVHDDSLAPRAHTGERAAHERLMRSHGLVLTWHADRPSRPCKDILLTPSNVLSLLVSPRSVSPIVFAGTEDGALLLWDLREPDRHHTLCALTPDHSTTRSVLRQPTFASFHHSDDDSTVAHSMPIVSIRLISGTTHDGPTSTRNKRLSKREKCAFERDQIASLDRGGKLIIWVVVQLEGRGEELHTSSSLRNDSSVLSNDLCVSLGGQVKLLPSATIDVSAQLPSALSPSRYCTLNDDDQLSSALLHLPMSGLTTLCFNVIPSDPTRLIVGTDMSYATLLTRHPTPKQHCLLSSSHFNRTHAVVVPSCHFPSGSNTITCIAFNPFLPDLFLLACADGSLSLHHLSQPRIPLIQWPHSPTTPHSILSLHWSPSRPSVFLLLDSSATLHLWDLLLSDAAPTHSQPLTQSHSSPPTAMAPLVITAHHSPSAESHAVAIAFDSTPFLLLCSLTPALYSLPSDHEQARLQTFVSLALLSTLST